MRKFITIVLSAVLLITSANLPSMLVKAEEAIGGSEITEINSNTDEQRGDQTTAGEEGNSDVSGTKNETDTINGDSDISATEDETNIVDGNSDINEENKQEDKTLAEEIDPEKGDRANSWRYQNGEQIPGVQSRTRAARSYHPNATRKGIDVSEHNGIIDWAQVKASGIDFAIIRCGYGMDQTDQDDKQWLRNVTECERLGIPYGVYIYSYATNTDRAKSEAEQQRGLQGVEHLEKNQGMLFVFHPARQVCMWMKDVPIDLDVGFFNDKGQLIAVRHMKAQTENTHCSPRPIAWALEMKAGWFQKKRLTEGARLRLN